MELIIKGTANKHVFSIRTDDFIKRQTSLLSKVTNLPDCIIIIRADIIVTDTLLTWLAGNGPSLITSSAGESLIACAQLADKEVIIQAFNAPDKTSQNVKRYTSGQSEFFARKLRRREPLTVYDLNTQDKKSVEKVLFNLSYKGITDCVTKYIFPLPTWHLVRVLSAVKVTPNMVTAVGIVLCIASAILFYKGQIGWALVAGWIMTFLDTVDGKLARVTATSSEIGNILDHGMDMIHPPIWWAAIGFYLLGSTNGDSKYFIISMIVLLATYLIGRLGETSFKKSFGFNAYMWTPFDSYLRLIIARRNLILLILTGGFLLQAFEQSYHPRRPMGRSHNRHCTNVPLRSG